jgi:hypothetical protein
MESAEWLTCPMHKDGDRERREEGAAGESASHRDSKNLNKENTVLEAESWQGLHGTMCMIDYAWT